MNLGSLAQSSAAPLRPIIELTGLPYLYADDGSLALPFGTQRTGRVRVQAGQVRDGLSAFGVELPKPPRLREQAALERLLRISAQVDYAKAVTVQPDGLGVVCEVPTDLVTPGVAAGLIRGLAKLGDMKRRDLARSGRWEQARAACGLCQASSVVIDARRARERVRSLAEQRMEEPVVPGNAGALLMRLDLGGSELQVSIRVTSHAVSLAAHLDGIRPNGDKCFLRGLLELNAAVDVAKVGLEADGDLTLLYQVPAVTPDLLERVSAQFMLLLAGVVLLDMVVGGPRVG